MGFNYLPLKSYPFTPGEISIWSGLLKAPKLRPWQQGFVAPEDIGRNAPNGKASVFQPSIARKNLRDPGIVYSWWFRNPKQPPGMDKSPVNNVIYYQPQLVNAGFLKHQQYHQQKMAQGGDAGGHQDSNIHTVNGRNAASVDMENVPSFFCRVS